MQISSLRVGLLLLLSQLEDSHKSSLLTKEKITWPGYQPKSAAAMLKRMEVDGEIKTGMGGYSITKLGRRMMSSFWPAQRFSGQKWDGWWRLVIFDIPEAKKVRRNALRHLLGELGCRQWQKSMYLSPHPVMREIKEFLKNQGLDQWVVCLECKQIGGMNDRDLADSVFGIKSRLERWWKLVNKGEQLMAGVLNKTEIKDWLMDWQKESQGDPCLPTELDSPGLVTMRQRMAMIVKAIL